MSGINVTKNRTYSGHQDCIYTIEKGATADTFFSSGGDGMVVIWDLKTVDKGKLIAKVDSSVYAMHYDNKLDMLMVGQNFEGIHFVKVSEKKIIGSLKTGNTAIFDIRKSRNRLFIACGDGLVRIVEELQTIKEIKLSTESARSIAIDEVRGEFAVGYSDNKIRVFDLNNFSLLYELNGHSNSVFTVVYSPDHSVLLSGSRDAQLKIWDAEKKYELKESINAHMYALNHIEFSPNANYFVTCSMDKSIKVWDSKSYKLLKVIDKSRYAGHGTSINKLLWSKYKGQLVACSDDHSISVWNVEFN